MGLFSFLGGSKKESQPKPSTVVVQPAAATISSDGLSPEIIAVITAAISMLVEKPFVCKRIQPSHTWLVDGRIKATALLH